MGKCVSDEDSGSSLGDADIEDDRSSPASMSCQ